jgi:hypothetical protein
MSMAFLDGLHALAEAKAEEEAAYRRESEHRRAALGIGRARAFRRYNFIKMMVRAAQAETDELISVRAQIAAVTAEAGLQESTPGYDDLCARLGEVAVIVHNELHGHAPSIGAIAGASDAFEAWYWERFQEEFLDRFDRERPSFQPVVDF